MMRWLPIASAGISVLTTLALVARDYPMVGHDYRYFIPRLLDTDLHLRLNGLSVQWYTPSFGAGIPAFPNPQHLQYSLVQALTFVSDPWTAILASLSLLLLAGFWGCYQVARDQLGLGVPAATLAATFFICNGFVIERAVVGHVGLQLFPIVSIMLWTLVDRGRSAATRGAWLGLVTALTLYQGGALVLILGTMTIAVCLPMLAAWRPVSFACRRVMRTTIIGTMFFGALTAPKVLAGLLFLREFPRHIEADAPLSLGHAIAGVVSQLAGVHTLAPIMLAMNTEAAKAYSAMVRISGSARYGVWELDIGLSPVLFACLAFGACSWWTSRRAPWSLTPAQRIFALLAVVAAWIALEASLGRGIVYPVLQSLPVLNTLHVHSRFVAVFILPLALAAGLGVNSWLAGRPWAGMALVAATWLLSLSYFLLPPGLQDRRFDAADALHRSLPLRASGQGVDRLAPVTDAEGFADGASSLAPYDPMFGYANESFAPEAQAGPVREVRDGYWNITNPASLVFPEVNGLHKFERIRVDDRERLELFLRRGQPDWRIPAPVAWSVRLAALALVTCFATIAAGFKSGHAHQ